MPATGSPLLIDVGTRDPQATADFYSKLLDWDVDVSAQARESYQYAMLDGEHVAGIRPDTDGPAAWTLYFATDDITTTTALAKDAGGQVAHGPVEVAEQGHVALIIDPTGAAFGLWQPTMEWNFRTGKPGGFAWAELHTPQAEEADAFYAKLFPYEQTQIGDGEHFNYTVWGLDGPPLLGRQQSSTDSDSSPHWLVYFDVDPTVGTDALVARALDTGATASAGPSDIPAGRTATIADPVGAVFALVDTSRATR